MVELNENWVVGGDDWNGLKTCLSELDSCTSYKRMRMGDLMLFYVLNPEHSHAQSNTSGLLGYWSTPLSVGLQSKYAATQVYIPYTSSVLPCPFDSNNKTAIKEIKNENKSILVLKTSPNTSEAFQLSNDSFMTTFLQRLSLAGKAFFEPSIERDRFLVQQLNTNRFSSKHCTVMYRTINGEKKAFAAFSNDYLPIPQVYLFELISKLETAFGDKCVLKSWFASQTLTQVYIEFPTLSEDIIKTCENASSRKIPNEMVFGIILQTSDTGHSSVIIQPTVKLAKKYLPFGKEAVRKHLGKDIDKANADLDERINGILPEYTLIPNKCIELLGYDLTFKNGGEITDYSTKVIKELVKGQKLKKQVETYLRAKLVSEITSFGFNSPLSAYDIAYIIIEFAEDANLDKILSETDKKNFPSVCSRAFLLESIKTK